MTNYFLMAGVLLNTVLIIVNRFVRKLPNCIQIPLLLAGIVLMIIGLIQVKRA